MARRVLIKQAAIETGLSEYELRTGAKQGRYPHLRVGNRYVFDLEQLDQFLKNQAMENMMNPDEEPIQYAGVGTLRVVRE